MPENKPKPNWLTVNPNYYNSTNLVNTQPFVRGTSPWSKYDTGLREGLVEEFNRGKNQSPLKKYVNAFMRFAPSTAAKVGEGFAGVFSAIHRLGESAVTGKPVNLTNIFDSPFTKLFSDIEANLEQDIPIHIRQKYAEGNLADKLWTAEFWTQDFADGLEFLTSFLIPGTVLTKAGKIGALEKGLQKAAKALKLPATENISGLALNTLYSTSSESLVEGKETFESVKKSLLQKNPNMDLEEVERIAGEAASNTFKYNMLYLAVPNFLESKWMFGKNSFDDLRKLSSAAKFSQEKLSPDILKGLGKGLLSEGLWEENLQAAVAEYEKRAALGELKPGDSHLNLAAEGVSGFIKSLPQIASFGLLRTGAEAGSYEDHAATSILLGGLMGGPMSAYSNYREYKDKKDIQGGVQDRLSSLDSFMKAANAQFIKSSSVPYKSFGLNEDGSKNYINPDTNKPELDKDVLVNIAFNHLLEKSKADEAMSAAVKNDELHAQYVIEKALSQAAYQIASIAEIQDLSSEDIDFLIDRRITNSLKEENKDDLEQKTSSKQLELQSLIQTRKAEIKEYVELFNQTKKELYSKDDFSDDIDQIRFNDDITRAAYYAKSLNKGLENLRKLKLGDLKISSEIDKLQADNNILLEEIKNNKPALLKKYKEQIHPLKAIQDKKDKKLKELFLLRPEERAAIGKDLIDQIKALELEEEYLKYLEGSENIKYTQEELNSSIKAIRTARMFGSRQTVGSKIDVPLKDLAYYAIGTTRLLESELQENDQLSPEDILKIFSNYLNENKVVAQSDLLDKIFAQASTSISNISEELGKLLEEDEELQFDEDYTQNPAIDILSSKIQQYEKILSYKKLYKDSVSKLGALVDAINNNSEPEFVAFFFDKKLAGTESIIRQYNKEGEDYTESPSLIKEQIELLEISLDFIDLKFQEDSDFSRKVKDRIQENLDLLKEIYEHVLNKSAQRASQQIELERIEVQSFLQVIKFPNILERIKQIIPDVESILEGEPSLSTILYVIDLIKSSQNKAVVADIQKTIGSFINNLKANNIASITSDKNLVDNYLNNTNYLLTTPLKQYLAQYGNWVFTPKGLFEQFEYNVDLNWFMKQMSDKDIYSLFGSSKDVVQQTLVTFYNNHNIINRGEFILSFLESQLNIKELVEEQTNDESPVKPAFQQNSTIIKTLTWLLSKYNTVPNSQYGDILAVKGIIGTGKTKVVIKKVIDYYLKLSGVSSDKVLLAGHSSSTTDQLNKVVKGTASDWTLDKFVNTDTLNDIKLIVIDEAAAFENEVLEQVLSKAKDLKIKVLLAGDLSQNKVESLPLFAYDNSVKSLDPLSVVYRTSVDSIANAAIQFKDARKRIDSVNFISNKESALDAVNDSDSATGVISLSEQNIISILSKPSTHSRKLIVTNEAEVNKYKALVDPSVEVTTFISVQGTEAEQAYIIIDKSLKHPKKGEFTDSDFNTAIYTSIGRATKFVGINLTGVSVEQVYSNKVDADLDRSKEDFDIISKSFIQYLNSVRAYFGLTPTEQPNQAKPKKAKDNSDTSEDESKVDESEEDTLVEIEKSIPPVPQQEDVLEDGSEKLGEGVVIFDETNKSRYFFKFPSNWALASKEIDKSKVFLLKNSDGQIYVIVKDLNYPTNNKVYVAAVLGEEDINEDNELSQYLKAINADKLKGVNIQNLNKISPFVFKDLDSKSLASFEVTNLNKLLFEYSSRKDSQPDFSLKNVVSNFLTSLFQGAKGSDNLIPDQDLKKIWNADGSINWSVASKYASVVIYTKESIQQNISKSSIFRPQPGIPYLVFNNISWESKSSKNNKTHNPLFVRLNPKKYNPKTMPSITYMQDYLGKIKTFYDAYKYVTTKVNSSDFKLNTTIKSGGKTVAGYFNQVIDSYARTFYEGKTVVLGGKSKSEVVKKQNPGKNLADWRKDQPISLDNLSDEDILSYFDVIVKSIYGSESRPETITLKEWQDLKAVSPDTVGEFEPTQIKAVAKPINKYLKENPGKTFEDAVIALKISTTSKGYYYSKDSSDNYFKVHREVLVRNQGPLQTALTAIASANKALKISTEKGRYSKRNNRITSYYFGAKQVLGISNRSKSWYGSIRDLLKSEIFLLEDMIMKAMSDEVLPKDYYGITVDGFTEDDGVKLEIKDDKIKILYVKNPASLLAVLSVIKEHVENAINNNTPNYFKSKFDSIESVNTWYNNVVNQVQEITDKNIETPTQESDLEEILHTDSSGTYSNIYTPVFINSDFLPEHPNMGVDKLGNLAKENNRKVVEELFTTNFEQVHSTKLSVNIPKVKQDTVKDEVKKNKTPTPEEILAHYEDPNSVEKVFKLKDFISEIDISKFTPQQKKLWELLNRDPKFMETEIHIIKNIFENKRPVSRGLPGIIKTNNIEAVLKSPNILIHELIHSVTVQVFYEKEENLSSWEKEFVKEIESILDRIKSKPDLFKKVFIGTISNLDAGEFIANLPNPDTYTELSKELISKGDIIKELKAVWDGVWKAIIKLLGKDTDTSNLYEATLASFNKYMESKFKVDLPIEQTVNTTENTELEDLLKDLKVSDKIKDKLRDSYKTKPELALKAARDMKIKQGFSMASVETLTDVGLIKKEC